LLCNATDWLAVQRQIQRRTFNRPKRTFGRLLLEVGQKISLNFNI